MLRPVAENVWEVERPQRVGLVQFRHRMTVVRLRGGGLWVHSPVEPDAAVRAALDALGRVEHLVAPSAAHDLHWEACLRAWPGARSHAPSALLEEHPQLPFTGALTGIAPPAWQDEFDQHLVGGMPRLDEVVFYHRASRTLIVADLLFNLGRDLDLFSGVLFWLFGTYGRVAVSRHVKALIDDREAARRSLERILLWDFDRIVVGHGEIIDIGGRRALERAWSFLLGS